jgi:hypothetical protein
MSAEAQAKEAIAAMRRTVGQILAAKKEQISRT